jgi:hypothetical protein
MKNLLLLLSLIFIVLFLTTCNKDSDEQLRPKPIFDESEIPVTDGEEFTSTVLGDQLNNPYHIDTMQHALQNLIGHDCQLSASHKYIRLLPSTIWQYMALLEDTSLILYDYPLDYELEYIGDYYQEPNIDLEDFTWLYTVVSVDKEIPDSIELEEICDLYLPEDSIILICDTTILSDDLIDEAFNLAGYDNESANRSSAASTKYNPEGNISVTNTSLGNEGIKNVKVKCKHWFNLSHTYTNQSGHFRIPDSYKGNVTINLEFQNSHCSVRGFRGLRVWQIADAVDVPVGKFSEDAMQNITFTIGTSNDVNSERRRWWMSANACNSVEEYWAQSPNIGVHVPPNHLNIWLTTKVLPNDEGSACLLKQIGNTSLLSAIIDLYLWNNANPADDILILFKRILTQLLPDITCGYNSQRYANSDEVSKLFYHELGHTSHYTTVGNSFWIAYIEYIILHFGYGNTQSNGVGRILVSEGWAHCIDHLLSHLKYTGNWLNELDNMPAYPTNFPFDAGGLYYDLTDTPELSQGITDNVTQYTIHEVFNALQSDVLTVSDFITKILSQNSNKQSTQVNDLFSSYNF